MVRCPECDKPLTRSKSHKYYCNNERCSVIYVKRPHQPAIMKVIRTPLPNEEKEQTMP
ncbi:hypothetical protein GWN65_03645 [Candidatus Bathyarchaeota archaeon]|nr:hypothetical protein [Candidatus Bathyarchaeota archaeon]NIV44521.1 hypothetical protein [Candidatus Bathyarchaeota archaeon]